jgi:hypothetical protein
MKTNTLAPIALFVYNRPEHTARTIAALARCPEAPRCDLHVFADGPRQGQPTAAVEQTRRVARSAVGFRSVTVVERERNMGLSRSIIQGVSEVLAGADRAVVMEDDLEVQADFLVFLNAALEHYRERSEVWSISGYMYPVVLDPAFGCDCLLYRRFSCWGWATWADRWSRVGWNVPAREDFLGHRDLFRLMSRAANDLPEIMLDRIDELNDSWSILFTYAQVQAGGFSVHPVRTLARNTGFDGSGTHARADAGFRQAPLEGFAGARQFRFADEYDPALVRPLDAYFGNRPIRKLKNLLRYGRWF